MRAPTPLNLAFFLLHFLSFLVPALTGPVSPSSPDHNDGIRGGPPPGPGPIFLTRRTDDADLSGLHPKLLHLVTSVAPISLTVDGGGWLLNKAESLLVPVVPGGADASDVAANKSCADVTLVWARGTYEPGNLGVLCGPQFIDACRRALSLTGKSMNVQGVEYDATIPAFLAGGGQDGPENMARYVQQAATQCPNTSIVMGGYSQGGQVVHNAAKALPAAVMDQVKAVVVFGDPMNGTTVAGAENRTLILCHHGDLICANGTMVLPTHMIYALDNEIAANFVYKMLEGEPL